MPRIINVWNVVKVSIDLNKDDSDVKNGKEMLQNDDILREKWNVNFMIFLTTGFSFEFEHNDIVLYKKIR